MVQPDLDIQAAWEPDAVRREWPKGPENDALLTQLWSTPVELTALDATGRVLEVAAAEAVHSCRLASRGLECVVVEPSPGLLAKAREHMARLGVRLHLVRAIGEALPFPDRSFDRVLCDSALDHFAAPELGVREMHRVLRPEGRLVLSFMNYASLSARVSRLWYRIDRARAPETAETLRFWDSPVPHEHTFEGTYGNILELCGQYLELERVVGASMLFGAPGWGALLRRLPARQAARLLRNLDKVARRVPGLADVLFTVWRPRRDHELAGVGVALLPLLARLGAARGATPPRRLATMRSSPADPIHRGQHAEALAYTARWQRGPDPGPRWAAEQPYENAGLTGDRTHSWLDDLMARGPFRRAALLGATPFSDLWLRRDTSPALDVFDPSLAALQSLRHRLAPVLHRVRLARADLNFLELPRAGYDVVWSDDALRDVVNLEHLLDEVAAALRPGGLFAYHGYVGERRQRFAPARLARMNAALREVPPRYRPNGVEAIEPPPSGLTSPHTAVRANEILPLARARFELVHEARTGALFPMLRFLDLPALEREAPEVLARLEALEAEARRDPAVEPALAYVVLRARS